MAASTTHTDYPLRLSPDGVLTFDAMELEHHLIQQLGYDQTVASTLVDEITSLVGEDKKSALHTAVERKAPHLVNVILQSVDPSDFMLKSADPSERLKFIQIQGGGSVGLYLIARFHLEIFRQILQCVSSDDERFQLLQMKGGGGWTVLHDAAANSAAEIVEVILESVSEKICYTLLSIKIFNTSTPILTACDFGNSEVLEMMMRLIAVEMRYKLLQLPTMSGLTPLHWSALFAHTQCIRVIADSVSSQQLIHLLRITDDEGRTPLQVPAPYNHPATVELLREYQTKALIDVALRHTDESGEIHHTTLSYSSICTKSLPQ